MKKYILIVHLFFFCRHGFSQALSIGAVGGAANTDISGIDLVNGDDYFHRVGFVGGAFVNRSFDDRVSVQLEVLYATKGSLQPSTATTPYFKVRLNYIEIPLLFKYKMHLLVNSESLDKLEIEVGMSYAQLLSSYEESSSGQVADDKAFNSHDYLFDLGLNYYFTKNFSFNIRFANSIDPIRLHDNNAIYYRNQDEYNTVFNYTFRYVFHSIKTGRKLMYDEGVKD